MTTVNTTSTTLKTYRPQEVALFVTFLGAFLCQLYFHLNPIRQVWYWPVVLFYMRVGGGLIGIGVISILARLVQTEFTDRHRYLWRALFVVTIGYIVVGFGTEYVAIINKPQHLIEQADRLVALVAATYAFVASIENVTAKLLRGMRIVSIATISYACYVVTAPESYPYIPIMAPPIVLGVNVAAAIVWTMAGIRFWQIGKREDSLWDRALGVSLILVGTFIGMRFFPVWSPLWVMYNMGGAVSYLVAAIVSARMIQFDREFQLRPYFAFSLYTLLVPIAILLSALSGYSTWRLSARSIEGQMIAFGHHLQVLYTHESIVIDSDTHASDSVFTSATFESLDSLKSTSEIADTDELRTLASAATYTTPSVEVFRYLAPGQIPQYHLLSVVPLTEETRIIQPFTLVQQEIPSLTQDVAFVRFATMLFVTLASFGLFVVLSRIINSADNQINRQQSQLSTALRELRAAEQGREDLTNMIVHDLRSPLSSIVSSLQLLQRMINTSDARQQRTLKRAITASDSMRAMIADILNISKMERGQLQLERTDIAIQDLIMDITATYEPQAQKEGKFIRQKLDITTAQPTFNADKQLIRRVFDNLITNAIRYTAKGGTITIGAVTQADQICFFVQDTGIGIPAENLPYIFEKFSQVSADVGQRREGVGLGLAFCKLAIETHEGKIWVESVSQEGSTFFFELPLGTETIQPPLQNTPTPLDDVVIVVGSKPGETGELRLPETVG